MWNPRSNDRADVGAVVLAPGASRSKDLTVRAAVARSRANVERSRDLLWFTRSLTEVPRIKLIHGASGHDAIDAVEALIARAALCLKCIAVKTGHADAEIQIAVRVLIRTSAARLADICESCRSASPAYRVQTST